MSNPQPLHMHVDLSDRRADALFHLVAHPDHGAERRVDRDRADLMDLLLVLARRTPPITWATAIEVSGIALLIWAATSWLGLVGAVAAAAAMLVGRLGATLVLCRAAGGGCRGEPTAPVPAVR